ncbi:NAD(P)H-dependent oxidoreductase [Paraburkholderia agricolaris]|uniref:NAD(P)H-dependent oxidoreductase n=1 Tax=Paraburkholderia agricolaris TaxID=2152888 RepID=UPI0038BBFACB
MKVLSCFRDTPSSIGSSISNQDSLYLNISPFQGGGALITSTQLSARGFKYADVLAGKTFRYTENGVEGLLKNKKAFIASARGRVYSADSPAAAFEHQESYLIGLLAFLGVTDVRAVRAEGIAFEPEARKAAVARAREDIKHHRCERVVCCQPRTFDWSNEVDGIRQVVARLPAIRSWLPQLVPRSRLAAGRELLLPLPRASGCRGDV